MRARFNPLTTSVRDTYEHIASALRAKARTSSTAKFHYDLVSRAAYPAGFPELVDRLQAGELEAVAPAVAWLDSDPFCRFSGYEKERIMRYLARSKLSTKQAATIRALLLRVIQRGGRPEFRMACRLARRVEDREFRDALRSFAELDDPGVRKRAGWMLAACERNDRRP